MSLSLQPQFGKTIVVSNRGPGSVNQETQTFDLKPGGLATAMRAAFSADKSGDRGTWVFWNDSDADNFDGIKVQNEDGSTANFDVVSVNLSDKQKHRFYDGFANGVLWPVNHSLLDWLDVVKPEGLGKIKNMAYDVKRKVGIRLDARAYKKVNKKFAIETMKSMEIGDDAWIHDYQLQQVASQIRKRNSVMYRVLDQLPLISVEGANKAPRSLGYFHHIPFPEPDVYKKVPNHKQQLKGLLAHDLIGFHVPSYVNNFLNTVDQLVKGADVNFENQTIAYKGRIIQVGDFPISMDPKAFESIRDSEEAQNFYQKLTEEFKGMTVGVGVDRVDYTKGIPERLKAIDLFLEQNSEYQGKFKFVQIGAKSREDVDAYKRLNAEVADLVKSINAKYPGEPIVWLEGMPQKELVPYMMVSDFALVTPLADGMNLVAKEYAVSQPDDKPGVLILGENAGVAQEFTDAIQVDPRDTQQTADAIFEAASMPGEQKKSRADALKSYVHKNDINLWQANYMTALKEAGELAQS